VRSKACEISSRGSVELASDVSERNGSLPLAARARCRRRHLYSPPRCFWLRCLKKMSAGKFKRGTQRGIG